MSQPVTDTPVYTASGEAQSVRDAYDQMIRDGRA